MAIYTKCSICRKRILKGTQCECSKARHKEYDKKVRYNKDNKKYTDFYNSIEWHRMSKYINIKYNSLCLRCLINHKEIIPNDVIHHIEELREDFDKRLDEDNLIPLCHGCHNNLHSNYTNKSKIELKKLLKLYTREFL